MKKLFKLAVLLVFIGAAANLNAQKWNEILRFHKEEATFPASIPLSFQNKYGWGGAYDSVEQMSNFKVVQTFREPLLCQFSGTGISSIGKADNSDPLTFVNDVIEVNGETYICLNYGEYVLLPRLQKLNKQTKLFEPHGDIKLSADFKFHYLGNEKVWFFGNYFEGKDKKAKKELNGSSIWDMSVDTLTRTHPTGGITAYEGHSVAEKDQSIFVLNGGGLEIMHFGSTALKTSEYPSIIVGGQFKKVVALSKENVFAIWQRDSDKANILLQLKNRKWEIRSEITYPDPVTQSATSLDFVVSSMEHYKGKLVITHSGSHVNGNPMGPIVVYDTTTNSWSGLPVPFALNTRTKFGKSYAKVLGDSVYLIRDNGDIFGIQPVWLLEHDGLLPIVLESFSGANESGTHLLQWKSSVEQNFSHYEIQASKEGTVFETVRKVIGRGSGIYNQEFKTNARIFYRLKMVDNDGFVRYSGTIVLGASVVSGRAYPNPTTGNVLVEVKSQGTLEVCDISGKKLQRQNVSPGTYQINLSSYAKGMYLIQLFVEGTLQTAHKILKN